MEEFFIFAQGQWIPNTRMCSSMRKHVTLTLRTSLGEGWRNLSYFCRNNPFSGTISYVNNQVLYFLRLFPMQCLSVAKGGHCTIMHGRYDDNSELSFITLFASFSCHLVKTISCPLEEDVKSWQSKPYPLRLTLLSNSVASQLPFLASWPFCCTSFFCQWPPSLFSKFVAFFSKSNSSN